MPATIVKRRTVVKKSPTSGKISPATKKGNKEAPQKKMVVGRVRKNSPAKSPVKAKAEKITAKEILSAPIYTEDDFKKKVQGMTFFQISNRLQLPITSERFAVAVEILKGGETRQDINHRVKELLPPSVRTKSPKTVSNLVSAVIKRMVECGFAVQGEWRMTPPEA